MSHAIVKDILIDIIDSLDLNSRWELARSRFIRAHPPDPPDPSKSDLEPAEITVDVTTIARSINGDFGLANCNTLFPYQKWCREKVLMYGAGILPYTIYKGRVYFLLGKDTKENTWSDFGGRMDPKDTESLRFIHIKSTREKTAAREFTEETCGVIQSYNTTLDRINSRRRILLIDSVTPRGHPYFMYLMNISKKDEYITNFKEEYTRLCAHFPGYHPSKEKCDIRWFLMEDLSKQALRPVFRETFSKNISRINSFFENNKQLQKLFWK